MVFPRALFLVAAVGAVTVACGGGTPATTPRVETTPAFATSSAVAPSPSTIPTNTVMATPAALPTVSASPSVGPTRTAAATITVSSSSTPTSTPTLSGPPTPRVFADLAKWNLQASLLTGLFPNAVFATPAPTLPPGLPTPTRLPPSWIVLYTNRKDPEGNIFTKTLTDFNNMGLQELSDNGAGKAAGSLCPSVCSVEFVVFRFANFDGAQGGFRYLSAKPIMPPAQNQATKELRLSDNWDDHSDWVPCSPHNVAYGDPATNQAVSGCGTFVGRFENILVYMQAWAATDKVFDAAVLGELAKMPNALYRALHQ